MNRTKVKIKKSNLVVFLLLFPHLRPESLAYIAPQINILYNIGRVMSFIIVIALLLFKRKKPSSISVAIALLQIWIVITTHINSGDMQRAFVNMMSVISLLLIIDVYAKTDIVKPIMWNVEWMIYLNLISIILYPEGLYRRGVHEELIDYFLGFKNAFFPYCIIAIFIAGLFYLQNKKNKVRSLALIVCSFLNVLLAWSASSVVAIGISILMFLLLVVIQRPKFLEKLRFRALVVLYVIIDIMVCVLNMIETLPFISNFITNVLHKQTTLSGRTFIWGMALQFIQRKPLSGYGIGEHITWRGYDWYGHNQIFEMLLEGGIPCLLFFILVIFMVAKQMDACKNRLVYSMLMSVFAGIFVFYIAEAGISPIFYMAFAIAYHINDIVGQNTENKLLKYGRK